MVLFKDASETAYPSVDTAPVSYGFACVHFRYYILEMLLAK